MLLDISDLDPRGVGLDRVVEVPPFTWDGGDRVTLDPVHLVGTLKPTRRGIELDATYQTVARLRCSRCLGEMCRPLGDRFRLFVVPPPGQGGDARGKQDRGREPAHPQGHERAYDQGYEEIPEDDPDAVDLYPLEGTVVDLAAVLREQVDLALPLRALCREDCCGLCAGCGVDLNVDTCRCPPARDERFAPLEQLKDILERRMGEDPSRGR